MIKYETSVEEAKQIKELGFDFSLVCEKFMIGPLKEGWSFNTHDREVLFKDGRMFDIDSNYSNCTYTLRFADGQRNTIRNLEQIICHQDDSESWCDNKGFGKLYYIPIIPYLILEACFPVVRTTAPFNGFFENSYKAFIWCVKNYPEETKQKFNKVMEMYK